MRMGSDFVDIVDLVDLLDLVAVDLNCLACMQDEDGDEDSELGSEVGADADKSVVPEWLKAELQDAKSEDKRGAGLSYI